MKKKLTKEKRVAQNLRREKLKELLGGARDLDGVNNLITDLRKDIIELLYDEEMKEHIGYSRHQPRPQSSDNYRNGSFEKTVKTNTGKLGLSVPRDRNGDFEPKIVKKHQTDILGIEEKIISLYASGLSTRDISDNIKEIYGYEISSETVSNITNRVLTEVKEWQARPLNSRYAVIFMDGMVFKIKKEGVIQKCTAYAIIGVNMDGRKEVLSIHIGGVESSKYWLGIMNELKSRGLKQVLIFCTDNLRGIDEAIKACYPESDHQKCIVHQIRNSVKHVSYKDLKEICNDLKEIYRAPSAEIGLQNLNDFSEKWDKKYAYISKSWMDNWEYLSAFWGYPAEIRRLIYTTNPIESFNRNMRKITKNKPTFPNEDALMKILFLGVKKLKKKWTTKIQNWGIIYSQLVILFDEKLNGISE